MSAVDQALDAIRDDKRDQWQVGEVITKRGVTYTVTGVTERYVLLKTADGVPCNWDLALAGRP